jgi:hypothetical protein
VTVEIIGNWAYAGTKKFVSHAITADGCFTRCGMYVHELLFRRAGQEWELSDAESVGCKKCNRILTAQATPPPAKEQE